MTNVIEFKKKEPIDIQTQTDTCIVIPARLGSTRFPEKMLEKVWDNLTLVEYVYKQCRLAHNATDVYVVTDSRAIANLFPGHAIMTPSYCENGTARIAHAASQLPYKYIINVQGDMIEFPFHVIGEIEMSLKTGRDVVTVIKEMDKEDQLNPNTVKCINNGEEAHWFCRAPIEYGDWHLGIYGYSKKALAVYPHLVKYAEEDIESLEQLRWLQNGQKVSITYTDQRAAEINTIEDLQNWQLTQQS